MDSVLALVLGLGFLSAIIVMLLGVCGVLIWRLYDRRDYDRLLERVDGQDSRISVMSAALDEYSASYLEAQSALRVALEQCEAADVDMSNVLTAVGKWSETRTWMNLYDNLIKFFDLVELQELAFNLFDITADDLAHTRRQAAQALIDYARRYGRLTELRQAAQERRPHVVFVRD